MNVYDFRFPCRAFERGFGPFMIGLALCLGGEGVTPAV